MSGLLKPASWVLDRDRLSADAIRLWQDCTLALPLWDSGSRLAEDVGPYKLHGAFGSGLLATDWSGSEYGPVVDFGATSNDIITIPDPFANVLDGCSALSAEVMFKPSSVTGSHALLDKYYPAVGSRSWRLRLNGTELELQVSSDGTAYDIQTTVGAAVAVGTWYRAVVTFASGVFKVYLQGKLLTVDGNFTPTSIYAGDQAFVVGKRSDGGAFSGQIASVRVWQRALGAEEVQYLYESPWAMYDPGLFLHLPFPGFSLLDTAPAAPVETYPTKPAPTSVVVERLSPGAQDLWRDCTLALPFWASGSRIVEDVGPYKLHGAFGSTLYALDWGSSPYGHALAFGGLSTDSISIPDPPTNVLDGCQSLSVEVLFRPTDLTDKHGLVGKYLAATGSRSWRLYTEGTELVLQVCDDGMAYGTQKTTGAALQVGTWYHAIATYKYYTGTFAVYLQGKSVAVDGPFGVIQVYGGDQPLLIGARSDGFGFKGQIASVRVWQRTLSAEEAQRLYEDPWGMYDPGILGLIPAPGLALLHSGEAAAGPWQDAGTVLKGVLGLDIPGLQVGTSYDVQCFSRDTTGNLSSGSAIVAATPTAPPTSWVGVRSTISAAHRPTRFRRALGR